MRNETSPEDVGGMHAARGILTARGGMTSHAAVVARGWGKCCVSGCSEIRVNESNRVSSLASCFDIILETNCVNKDRLLLDKRSLCLIQFNVKAWKLR